MRASLAVATAISVVWVFYEVWMTRAAIAAPAGPLSFEDPLDTPFEVTNTSRLWSLKKAHGVCHVVEIRAKDGSGTVGGDLWRACEPVDIGPGEGDRIDCSTPYYFPAGVVSADMDVGITYQFSPLSLEREDFFRFELYRDDEGKFGWTKKPLAKDGARRPDTRKGVTLVRPCFEPASRIPVTRGITVHIED